MLSLERAASISSGGRLSVAVSRANDKHCLTADYIGEFVLAFDSPFVFTANEPVNGEVA